MPKVYLSEQDKLNNRLASWVYGEMKVHGLSQKDLANERGISQPALSQKLQSKSFSYEDVCCFVRVFNPDTQELERLFK